MGAFNLGDCKISYFHIHLQLLAQLFFVAALLTWTKDFSIPKGVSCVTKVSYMI